MEIVLTQYVEDLGPAGKVVRVSSGYARNYLLPRKLAVPATPANLKVAAETAYREEVKVSKVQAELGALAAKLAKVEITAAVKVGEDEKVFGSVTARQIAEMLREKKYDFEAKDINLGEPLKALGQYDVEVKLGYGVKGSVKVWVVEE